MNYTIFAKCLRTIHRHAHTFWENRWIDVCLEFVCMLVPTRGTVERRCHGVLEGGVCGI